MLGNVKAVKNSVVSGLGSAKDLTKRYTSDQVKAHPYIAAGIVGGTALGIGGYFALKAYFNGRSNEQCGSGSCGTKRSTGTSAGLCFNGQPVSDKHNAKVSRMKKGRAKFAAFMESQKSS